MNWRRGILLAAINLVVALPPVIWLEHTEAAYLREYEHDAAKQANTESPVVAPNQAATTSGGAVTFTIEPCSIVDGYPPQQDVVILANIPAEVLAGWRDFCPARWTLSGMLHMGGWWSAAGATTMTTQRKADIGFLLLIALQWFLVGGFPLRQPKRLCGEPGAFITICAVLAVVVVFVRSLDDLAKFFALLAAFAWLWWSGLLLWKLARFTWKWTARHLVRSELNLLARPRVRRHHGIAVWTQTMPWMPLSHEGKARMRANLLAIQAGQKVHSVSIGALTPVQLAHINAQRAEDDLPLLVAEVLFVGAHVYRRRVLKDGYEIEDVIEEAESALSGSSEFIVTSYMTALHNPVPRVDRLGNLVNDRAIFECTKYRPNPELFSVQPKGDRIKPARKR